MVRYGLGIWMVFFLFLGCSGNQTMKPAISQSQSLASHGFQLHAGDKIHELNGIPLRLEDKTSVKILVPESYYVYVFSRQNKEVRALPFYDQTPGRGIGTKSIEFSSLDSKDIRNTEWFFVRSDQSLSQDKRESLRHLISETKGPSPSESLSYPKIDPWHILSMDWKDGVKAADKPFHLLGNIEILSAPFSVQIFVQKKGTKEFRLFNANKESLEVGDTCKFRIDTYQDIKNIAFFLRESSKVKELFPAKGNTTVSISSNTTLNFPIEKELTILDDIRPKHLCCFCSPKTLSCKELQEWLHRMDASQEEIVLRGHKGVTYFDVPAPLYTVTLADKIANLAKK